VGGRVECKKTSNEINAIFFYILGMR
jgi:hypothetical protein